MTSIVDVIRRKSLVEYLPDMTLASDGSYRSPCPLHGGSNPTSFAVFPDSNRYYCFSCGESGDIISFVMCRDGLSFDGAVHKLADDFGIPITNTDDYHRQFTVTKRNEMWKKGMRKNLSSVIDYLHKRGFMDETIARYGIGYSTKLQGISIPMEDEWGRCVAFLYRFFDKTPKYKNSKNVEGLFVKGKFLFGLPQAMKSLKTTKTFMLCEGAFDAMSAVQQGNCCVAYCGISVTQHHILKIRDIISHVKGSKVVICPDNDGKASKFVLRARELFQKLAPSVTVKVAVIPEGSKDFNDMLVNGEEIAACKQEAIDLYCAKQVVFQSEDRDMQEKDIVSFVSTVKSPLVKADIAMWLSDFWGRTVAEIRELLSVKEDTTKERLQDIVTVDKAYSLLENKQEEEKFGIGFSNVDTCIQLWRKCVLVLGAYSFSGKSDMLVEFILYWCIVKKMKILFFSMEMPTEDVMKVIVAKVCQIPRWKVGEYIKENKEAYDLITEKLKDNLFIVDKNGLSMEEMEEYVRLLRVQGISPDVVCVDYFQYMKNVSTVEEQEQTAQKMKAFAKSMGVLFVMLSQLRKASQSKEKDGKFHEPTQADLAGAGGIGNSADFILLMWRPALNSSLSPIDREKQKYTTLLKITKAREVRNGNTMFELKYNPETSRISEVENCQQ